jgi:hypothetical protein
LRARFQSALLANVADHTGLEGPNQVTSQIASA